MKLSRINMYRAKMEEGLSEANYCSANSSIYFNHKIPFNNLEEFAVHECIHYLQEVKDKKNYLIRMGLCNYTEFKTYGMGLNEAAVQLLTAKVIGIPTEEEKYFNINFSTNSPSYYPLECNLVNQMAYLVGEDILFDSTLNSNDNFKNAFIRLTSEKTFYAIQNALDTILASEESIIKINNKINSFDDRNQKVDKLLKKIDEHKKKIVVTFMRTQNLIVSSYFNNQFNHISNLEELESYRKKLQNYCSLIGTTAGYTFFNDFYIDKMAELEYKSNLLENGDIELSLKPISTNKFIRILKAIKSILFDEKEKSKITQKF